MGDKRIRTAAGGRVYFMDNLRTFMVFLVVLVHAGFVYDYSLSFLWIIDDPAKSLLIFRIFMIIDIFLIPVLFFVSGYFVPSSSGDKTAWGFLWPKIKRLIIPWIIAVLTLIPLYKIIFLYSRGFPQQHPTTYFHFSKEIPTNQGWLWFLPVLFLFNLLYYVIFIITRHKTERRLSPRSSLIVVLSVGIAYSFVMYSFRLQGWTKTIILDFQNERLLIYFLAFLSGAFSRRRGWFEGETTLDKRFALAASMMIVAGATYYAFQWNWNLYQGAMPIASRFIDNLVISVSYNLALVSFLSFLIILFRRFFNLDSRILRVVNRNTYGVYIIHFVVTGGIALILLTVELPAIAKWMLLTLATFAVSHALVFLYRSLKHIVVRR